MNTTQLTYAPTVLLPQQTPEVIATKLKTGTYKLDQDGLHKRCPRCKEYWPADAEFFYSSPSKKDGLHDWCKACYVEWRYPFGRSIKSLKS